MRSTLKRRHQTEMSVGQIILMFVLPLWFTREIFQFLRMLGGSSVPKHSSFKIQLRWAFLQRQCARMHGVWHALRELHSDELSGPCHPITCAWHRWCSMDEVCRTPGDTDLSQSCMDVCSFGQVRLSMSDMHPCAYAIC